MKNKIRNKIWDKVYDQVWHKVYEQVDGQVYDQVRIQVWFKVDMTTWWVDVRVMDNIREYVADQYVADQVWNRLRMK